MTYAKNLGSFSQLLSPREDRGAALGETKKIKCVNSRQGEGGKKEGVVPAVRGQIMTRDYAYIVFGFGLVGGIDDCR